LITTVLGKKEKLIFIEIIVIFSLLLAGDYNQNDGSVIWANVNF